MATIAVLGTLDTKGIVHQFLAERIRRRGHQPLLIDASLRSSNEVSADISRSEVLGRAGVEPLALAGNQGRAAAVMGQCLGGVLNQLFLEGKLDGVVGVGGRCGMRVLGRAVSGLPFGLPCVLGSHALGEAAEEIQGGKDVLLLRCLLEPGALNGVVRPFLNRVAGAVCGMAQSRILEREVAARPVIVGSCFGHSEITFGRIKRLLEKAGYDVVVFTQKGAGGRIMDSVIASGIAAGVIDLSTTDVADAVVGGVCSAGPARLEAAGRLGIPAVVVPGGIDMVSLDRGAVPQGFEGRLFAERGKGLVMRSSALECWEIGRRLAEKLNEYRGPVTVCLPLRGVSALSAPGEPFHDPDADRALLESLTRYLDKRVGIIRIKTTSEDAPFAEECAQALLENIKRQERDFVLLGEMEVFAGASEAELKDAARLLEVRVFEAGANLHSPQSAEPAVYFLLEGAAEVLEGGERTERLSAGAAFGERQLVFGEVGSATLRCLEPCRVLVLSSGAFERLCIKHPRLEDALIELALKRQKTASTASGAGGR
jgi:uncharacterized protein (UPF0261 family)